MKNQLIKSNGSLFNKVVKGSNFMTPELIGYYKIRNGEVELTKGYFIRRTIYGVTVVRNGIKQNGLNQCHDSEQEALDYIKSIAD